MKRPIYLLGLIAGSVLPVVASSSSDEAPEWSGATNSLWNTSSNWYGKKKPTIDSLVVFASEGNSNTLIDLGTGASVKQITFSSPLCVAYTLGFEGSGQKLTLKSSGKIIVGPEVVASQGVDANLVLGTSGSAGTYTISEDPGPLYGAGNPSPRILSFAGSISGGSGSTAGVKTLKFDKTGSVHINGNISNGGASSLAIVQDGAGVLTLSGTNTHTGATTINAGKLVIEGSTPAPVLKSGTTLAGHGSVTGALNVPTGATLAPGDGGNGVFTVGGTATLASGSKFVWTLDPTSETGRGHSYPGLNCGGLTGSGAVMHIVLPDAASFSESFWDSPHEWSDIFRAADGTTPLASDPAAVFSGGFVYVNDEGAMDPTEQGAFSWRAAAGVTSLVWTPARIPTLFEIWAEGHHLAGGPDDDDDHDGLSNLLEYGLGLDLGNTGATGSPIAFSNHPLDASYLLLVAPLNPEATDVTVILQHSTGLGSAWTAVPEGDPDYFITLSATEIQLLVPKHRQKEFFRLSVSPNPPTEL